MEENEQYTPPAIIEKRMQIFTIPPLIEEDTGGVYMALSYSFYDMPNCFIAWKALP
jgi:hypothetical protein